eukprot:CAMPEP_0117674176 /NCGR_PEP_ID=MMETSP0804-20121206/14888_1 /TAXON_ID=1074897 /ORGANISM="Tetraselmis astigmatica, Strain CCMP880" /LENGTH=198 /DNA_ID=CAMNT_0005483007 /DNA_START=138 /DNA_END=734 /DNA_ORIENTATION=+
MSPAVVGCVWRGGSSGSGIRQGACEGSEMVRLMSTASSTVIGQTGKLRVHFTGLLMSLNCLWISTGEMSADANLVCWSCSGMSRPSLLGSTWCTAHAAESSDDRSMAAYCARSVCKASSSPSLSSSPHKTDPHLLLGRLKGEEAHVAVVVRGAENCRSRLREVVDPLLLSFHSWKRFCPVATALLLHTDWLWLRGVAG